MEKKIWFGKIVWLWRITTYICIYRKLFVVNLTTTIEKVICSGSKLSSIMVSEPLLVIDIDSGS
jgi:hypothetical protein